MKIQRTRITLSIPPTTLPRVQRAAEMRGLSIEDYIVTLLMWHAPAFDNDAQYLKSKLRDAMESGYSDTNIVNRIKEIVR